MAGYNKKKFLAPDALRSMSAIHCKIVPEFLVEQGVLRISDCHNSIRIHNNLHDPKEALEMIEKLGTIITEVSDFQSYIYENYVKSINTK